MGRPVQPFVQLVLLFLLAVVLGRLMLEPSGVGLVVVLVAAPLLLVLLVAWQGWRGGAFFIVFLGLLLLARVLFQVSPSAWVLLLMAPVVLATSAVAVSVASRLLRDARR